MFAILSLLLTPSAEAYVFWGNPELKLEIDRTEGDLVEGDVELVGVRVTRCNGTYNDYMADTPIDPVAGWTTTISGGNLCRATAWWSSDGVIWSSAFTLKSDVEFSPVDIVGPVSSAAWEDWVVTGGTFTGSHPVVKVTIQ